MRVKHWRRELAQQAKFTLAWSQRFTKFSICIIIVIITYRYGNFSLIISYHSENSIQVPPNFRAVVEATLKEFFVSIQAGRDAEPSWKKAIYKVIARLDDPIPEYFKTPNFLEQLE